MIKHRTPAPTHRRSTGGLTGYILDAELIVVRNRGEITDTAAAEVPASPGQRDDALT